MLKKRSSFWLVKHAIHNVVAHPMLPVAELCLGTYLDIVAYLIHKFHDLTNPEEDRYNNKRFYPK